MYQFFLGCTYFQYLYTPSDLHYLDHTCIYWLFDLFFPLEGGHDVLVKTTLLLTCVILQSKNTELSTFPLNIPKTSFLVDVVCFFFHCGHLRQKQCRETDVFWSHSVPKTSHWKQFLLGSFVCGTLWTDKCCSYLKSVL